LHRRTLDVIERRQLGEPLDGRAAARKLAIEMNVGAQQIAGLGRDRPVVSEELVDGTGSPSRVLALAPA
jgi:hypothetical protein